MRANVTTRTRLAPACPLLRRGAIRGLPSAVAALATLSSTLLAASASAVDLKVDSVTLVQAVQLGSTTLVGGRAVMVRVKVGVTGAVGAVPGVDARLRVFVNNVELAGSPYFSGNGPIAAPTSPNFANLNDTINFPIVVPQSSDVDFIVEVDPAGFVAESSEANNTLTLANQVFACRDVVEVVGVSVNYTPGGGLPPAELVKPGIGDGFLRAIYAPKEFNYHRSPIPLTWTSNINSSDNTLLNTLKDMLVAQIPAAGYPKPDFIYGWLPGNPYSGNGKANGIPGEAAFGNTELSRFQRTFAHEVGHLVGLQHNSDTVGTNGIDVEQHLWETEQLPQLFASNKKDVMVAGQLTNAAFVSQASFNKFLNDSRVACTPGAPPAGGGEGDDQDSSMLRISGEIVHQGRVVSFDPVVRIGGHPSSVDDPTGDLRIVARDAAGEVLWQLRVDTQRNREFCGVQEGMPAPLDASPFHVLAPSAIDGVAAASIEIIDEPTGALLATRARSRSAPSVQVDSVEKLGPEPMPLDPTGQPYMDGTVRVAWSASDADGDALSHFLYYSPDQGGSWLPLAVRQNGDFFEFDSSSVPSSRGPKSTFFVRTTDGFDSTDSPLFEAAALGGGNPPDVHLLSPNDFATHKQHAPIILHASAWDLEDLLLPESSIVWASQLQGVLGTGRTLVVESLMPGEHILVVTGTDSDGMSSSAFRDITVTPRVVLGADLSHDGIVDGQDLGLLLSGWGTASGDLDGNGIVDGADVGVLLANWG
jgi:hypothetical protein